MRKTITVNPITHGLKLPKEAIEDGFIGELDCYPNAATFTLVRPGANLEDVETSLVRTLDDIRHRIKLGINRPPTGVGPSTVPVSGTTESVKKKVSLFDELRARMGR